MPRVLVLTRYDRMGASSRVRFLQYLPHLERQGFSFDVQALLSDDHLVRLYREGRRSAAGLVGALAARLAAVLGSGRFDLVWLQQEIFPFLPAGFETLLLRRPFVVDFDDAYHLYYQQHHSGAVRAFYGAKIPRLMRAAAAVVAGSDTMAEVARASGARQVHLVPSAVDCTRFPERAPEGPFTVGWIGTPMTAEQSLFVLAAPLKRFLGETGSRCVLLGVEPGQFADLPAERIPWSEAAEETHLPRFSVGLCPLDDSPWTRGKSGYKIIQYMAVGRAALASPVGIAARLVEPGVTGLHCLQPDDWYAGLKRLHEDATLCADMGRAARLRAEERYDTRVASAALAEILTAAAR